MMQALIDSLMCILVWIGEAFQQVFVDLFEALGDVVVYVFDMAGDLVISAFNAFDFESMLDVTAMWNLVPPQAINVISAIGLHQAFGIIVSAMVVRFVLQLIPFVRLGS